MYIAPTNERLIIYFLNQLRPQASNRGETLWYKGNKLYSYRSLLAIIDLPNKVLFIDNTISGYSVTTAKQTCNLKSIASNFTIYSIPLGIKPDEVLMYYWDKIQTEIGKFRRARKHKENRKALIKELMSTAESYATCMNIDKRFKSYKFKYEIIRQLFKHKVL
jgi:hypothetical protein